MDVWEVPDSSRPGRDSCPPSLLSTTFADNYGAGAVLLRDGSVTLGTFPGGTSPNGFGP
jgi:hypothetical protein